MIIIVVLNTQLKVFSLSKVGSGFGFSLATADLNNDGYSEL